MVACKSILRKTLLSVLCSDWAVWHTSTVCANRFVAVWWRQNRVVNMDEREALKRQIELLQSKPAFVFYVKRPFQTEVCRNSLGIWSLLSSALFKMCICKTVPPQSGKYLLSGDINGRYKLVRVWILYSTLEPNELSTNLMVTRVTTMLCHVTVSHDYMYEQGSSPNK